MTEKQKPKLPSWANWKKDQVIVDMDEVYPVYLERLHLEASQFSTGVVKMCITRDLSELINTEGLMIRFNGTDQWAIKNLPHGLPEKYYTPYQLEDERIVGEFQAGNLPEEQAMKLRDENNNAWLGVMANSHDHGLQEGGKYRQRILDQRAADALAAE